ncbi:MAG TPA: hypothetical protein EYH58_05310 [Aquifex aeolicus]|nr:hypothetical protein [Aquifex aeolicus]
MEKFSVELLFDTEVLNKVVSSEEAKKDQKFEPIYEYFMNILKEFEEDLIAFDIVYPSPETGEYNFISFFKKSFKESSGGFVEIIQEFAKEDWYRKEILSLSSILIEKSLEKEGLKLNNKYRNLAVIKRVEKEPSTLNTSEAFLFPFKFLLSQSKEFQEIYRENIANKEKVYNDIKDIIKKDIEHLKEDKRLKQIAYTFMRLLIENIENLEKEKNLEKDIIEKFARYLAWINMLADWKMYVYISVDISQEYNFGLVLLLKSYKNNIHNVASEIINRLRKQFVRDFAEYFLRKLRKKAIINAMATIMSRNMSHNIGSHILFYINSDKSVNVSEEINKFIRYLQQRMDFIAYISTGEWLPVGSIHFLIEDVILGFLKQKLLLNYIGFSEGVKLDNLVVNVCLNDKKVISLEKGEINRHSKEDVKVFIPLGVVGFQALYSIFENIIRNSAKYGFATKKKEDKNTLEITIKIEEEEDSNLVKLRISDNVSEVGEKKAKEIEKEILKPILSETGEIDLRNWGLKEIKICSTFLSGKDIEVLNRRMEKGESPVEVEGKGNLTYVIKLIKGEEVYDERT